MVSWDTKRNLRSGGEISGAKRGVQGSTEKEKSRISPQLFFQMDTASAEIRYSSSYSKSSHAKSSPLPTAIPVFVAVPIRC